MENAPSDLTQLLAKARAGDKTALSDVFSFVERELKRRAHEQLARRRPDAIIDTTSLVDDVYLNLMDGAQSWQDREHFFNAAAGAIRNILVDAHRKARAAKRGLGWRRTTSEATDLGRSYDLLDLNDALELLAKDYPRHAKVVELRYFAGRTVKEAADILGVGRTTVQSDWRFAKAWLRSRLGGPDEDTESAESV